jgi:hypothetical protein
LDDINGDFKCPKVMIEYEENPYRSSVKWPFETKSESPEFSLILDS